jgi:hypothetical protein
MAASNLSPDLVASILGLQRALDDVKTRVQDLESPEEYSNTTDAIETLITALALDFDGHQQRGVKRQKSGLAPSELVPKLRRSCRHYNDKKKEAERALAEDRAEKLGIRICSVWFARVGLAPPCVPYRSLAQFCRDFSVEESAKMSFSYVGRVRDAFVEIIKSKNREQMSTIFSASMGVTGGAAPQGRPVFIKHVPNVHLTVWGPHL